MSYPGERYEALARRIALSAPPGWFTGGVTEADVQAAEVELGARLSDSYRWFLMQYGSAAWPDYIHGLGPLVPRGLNVVNATIQERNEVEPPLAPNLIAISPDGFGNHFCLDFARTTEGEAPVVLWNHEFDEHQVPKDVKPSFLDWFEELITWGEEHSA